MPGKNLRLLLGRPLIAHTVSQALESELFDAVAVSSDSREILDAGAAAGASILVLRPDELATDTAGKTPAIVHCIRRAEEIAGREFGIITDLDATSPLRNVADIAGAVRMLETSTSANLITASPARRSPYFNLVERDASGFAKLSKGTPGTILRRQDAPACFDMNASIYVWRRDALLAAPGVFYPDTLLFEMPEERSHDIDTELDFEWVSYLMGKKHGK